MTHAAITFATLGVVLAASAPAAAQDPRVEIQTAVTAEILRNVRVMVDVAPAVGSEISRAVREAVKNVPVVVVDQSRDFRAEQVDKQTRTLALGPSGSLELRNISGAITVTAGSGRDVTVDIVRTSRGRTDADAKLGLGRVTVEVDHRGDRATIETRYPSGDRRPVYSVSVTYNVTAPAGTTVRLASISGNVTVKGLKGDVAVDVTSGDVNISGASGAVSAKTISGNVTISDITRDGNLDVDTVSGDVLLQQIRVRRLSAVVVSGKVVARDITTDNATLKAISGTVEFAGPLSRNGRYELHAHSGSVRAVVVGQIGFELDASTFSGTITPNVQIKVVTTKSRRSLRGTVGDGSARLIATTFSGDISISNKN